MITIKGVDTTTNSIIELLNVMVDKYRATFTAYDRMDELNDIDITLEHDKIVPAVWYILHRLDRTDYYSVEIK